jgi:protein-S-isoprenylcysteine O-methyltransferase Ste14
MFREKIYPYLLVFLQLGSLVYILSSEPALARGYAGILVESAGIFLGVLAILNMGIGNFNVTPRNKNGGQLVTHGIYKLIRHPMYFAQLVALLPLIFDYFTFLRLAVYLVLLVTLLLKIKFEEESLSEHFSGYPAYMEKTKKLIPFIY